jgi:hypothetical protein
MNTNKIIYRLEKIIFSIIYNMLYPILAIASLGFVVLMTSGSNSSSSSSSTQAGGNKKNKTSNKSKTRRKRVRKNKSYKK